MNYDYDYSDDYWDLDEQNEKQDRFVKNRFTTGIISWWRNTKKSWQVLYQISPFMFKLNLGKHVMRLCAGVVPVIFIKPVLDIVQKGISPEMVRTYMTQCSWVHILGLVATVLLSIAFLFLTPRLGVFFERLNKKFTLAQKLYVENLNLWIPYEYMIDSKKHYQLRKFYDFVDGIFHTLNDQVGILISVVSSIVAIFVGIQIDSTLLLIVSITVCLQFMNQYYAERKEFSNANAQSQELLEMRTSSLGGALDFPDLGTRLARQVNRVFTLFTQSSHKLIERELVRDNFDLVGQRNSKLISGVMYLAIIGFAGFKLLKGNFVDAVALYYMLNHITTEASSIIRDLLDQVRFKRELGYVEHILALSEHEKNIDQHKKSPSVDQGVHISIRNVSYHYPVSKPDQEIEWILKDCSLEISMDKMYGVSAENGTGKTTLLNIIMGFLTPVSGEVLINNIPVSDIKREWFDKHVTVFSQEMDLISGMTLAEFLAPDSVQTLDETSVEVMRTILNEVGLARKMKNKDISHLMLSPEYPNGTAFSQGETQKLLIARMLVTAYFGARYGLVDEMTSNIPHKEQKKFAELLRKYTKGSILIAHNPEIVSVCDYIITYDNYTFTI